jgi:hypothetical protein
MAELKAGTRVYIVQGRLTGKSGVVKRSGDVLSLVSLDQGGKVLPIVNVNLAKLDSDKSKTNDGLITNAVLAALLIKLWDYATSRPDKLKYVYRRSPDA